jgi:hypothetical protein
VLQDFCSRHRWYWREKSVAFTIAAGESEYDLSSPTLGADFSLLDVEQISSVKLFLNDQAYYLRPLFEEDEQDLALEGTTQATPTSYFLAPGRSNILRFAPIPNGAYKARVRYWAMPNTTPDAQGDLIPLVPGSLHMVLVDGLEAEIYRQAVGEKSSEYLAAQAKYEARIQQASRVRNFNTGRVREWTSNDDAVRST